MSTPRRTHRGPSRGRRLMCRRTIVGSLDRYIRCVVERPHVRDLLGEILYSFQLRLKK
jgi:hypothetical protein